MKKALILALLTTTLLIACNNASDTTGTTTTSQSAAVSAEQPSASASAQASAVTQVSASATTQPNLISQLNSSASRGRDAARIANLNQFEKVLIMTNLECKPFPITSGPITENLAYTGAGNTNTWAELKESFLTGKLPSDPTPGKNYYFVNAPAANYAMGLFALVELAQNANATCTTGSAPSITMGEPTGTFDQTTWCYAVLAQ